MAHATQVELQSSRAHRPQSLKAVRKFQVTDSKGLVPLYDFSDRLHHCYQLSQFRIAS